MTFVYALYLFVGGNSPETARFMDRIGTYQYLSDCFVVALKLNEKAANLESNLAYQCVPIPKQ